VISYTMSGTTAVSSPASAEVSGAIVHVGGPLVLGPLQNSSPMTATAVVYHPASNESSISGTPVVKVHT
jgi:hypothetical protein